MICLHSGNAPDTNEGELSGIIRSNRILKINSLAPQQTAYDATTFGIWNQNKPHARQQTAYDVQANRFMINMCRDQSEKTRI